MLHAFLYDNVPFEEYGLTEEELAEQRASSSNLELDDVS